MNLPDSVVNDAIVPIARPKSTVGCKAAPSPRISDEIWVGSNNRSDDRDYRPSIATREVSQSKGAVKL